MVALQKTIKVGKGKYHSIVVRVPKQYTEPNAEQLQKINQDKNKDPKVGEGFSDARGYIPEIGPIPKHNGLNTNNEPEGMQERELAKVKRR